ncbi:hypothetical protein AN214_04270 [Pseudoalteromonas sp. P1-9]|uniref:hypothetical protein n=1 Tax=Pseudoalteromonas sp. P1-9 TaxID=1710354 RepID=UPI0007083B1A|nr:hypothetical protein [Pseudoalteromonas sp. P1-9]KPV93687.1 hypothetical protein AN214_04270 [Pseudoalteromonas sp. P1-9]
MLTAFEFINVEQLHKKNSALLSFHLSSATSDHILNRIGMGGPSWYLFARAPEFIIASSRQETLLAAIGTTIVTLLMTACAIFAFSAVGIIRRVPFLKSALVVIATISILRGLLGFAIGFFSLHRFQSSTHQSV